MKLIGTVLLAIWLVIVGLDWAGYVISGIKFQGIFAIVTGAIIALETLNVIEK